MIIDFFNTGGGSGSGATWGNITGTLSAQTDLKTALEAKTDADYYDAESGLRLRIKSQASKRNISLISALNNDTANLQLTPANGLITMEEGDSGFQSRLNMTSQKMYYRSEANKMLEANDPQLEIVVRKDLTGGTSGATAWGNITGTLSAQTDLQEAFDNKVDRLRGTVSNGLGVVYAMNNSSVRMFSQTEDVGAMVLVQKASSSADTAIQIGAQQGSTAAGIGIFCNKCTYVSPEHMAQPWFTAEFEIATKGDIAEALGTINTALEAI